MANDVEIASRALVSIGALGIQAFNDETAEADVARIRYAGVRDDMLTRHTWAFAKNVYILSPDAAAPLADFDYAFTLPAKTMRVVSVGSSSRMKTRDVPYRIVGRKIYCDADGIAVTVVERVPEKDWPAYFVEAMVKRLAAEFVMPLTESTSKYEQMVIIADDAERKARRTDSQSQTPQNLRATRLVGVR